MNQIRVFTGRLLDPLSPNPEDIDIRDIAHALARMPRFAGHTHRFYSVAEHCLRCLQLVESKERYGLEVLLHDASEAYLMDIPKPIKHRLPDYIHAEKKLENSIDIAFGLNSLFYKKKIKEIDEIVLQEELVYLFEDMGVWMPSWYNVERKMQHVEDMFLEKFQKLWTLKEQQ